MAVPSKGWTRLGSASIIVHKLWDLFTHAAVSSSDISYHSNNMQEAEPATHNQTTTKVLIKLIAGSRLAAKQEEVRTPRTITMENNNIPREPVFSHGRKCYCGPCVHTKAGVFRPEESRDQVLKKQKEQFMTPKARLDGSPLPASPRPLTSKQPFARIETPPPTPSLPCRDGGGHDWDSPEKRLRKTSRSRYLLLQGGAVLSRNCVAPPVPLAPAVMRAKAGGNNIIGAGKKGKKPAFELHAMEGATACTMDNVRNNEDGAIDFNETMRRRLQVQIDRKHRMRPFHFDAENYKHDIARDEIRRLEKVVDQTYKRDKDALPTKEYLHLMSPYHSSLRQTRVAGVVMSSVDLAMEIEGMEVGGMSNECGFDFGGSRVSGQSRAGRREGWCGEGKLDCVVAPYWGVQRPYDGEAEEGGWIEFDRDHQLATF